MCRDSEVSGESVYIDTSAAMLNNDTSTRSLCTCKATVKHARFYNLSISGNGNHCGSRIMINSSKNYLQSKENCSVKIVETTQTGNQSSDLDITLEIMEPPFIANFCIAVNIGIDLYVFIDLFTNTVTTVLFCTCQELQQNHHIDYIHDNHNYLRGLKLEKLQAKVSNFTVAATHFDRVSFCYLEIHVYTVLLYFNGCTI